MWCVAAPTSPLINKFGLLNYCHLGKGFVQPESGREANYMTSKNTALLDMPSAEFVKEAYGKAEELKLSFPEISALLRAAAGRIDVFNALLVLSSSVNVQRYSPDYQMHLNHEMAIMRPTDKGTFVSLADYVALLKEHNDLNNQLQALAAENLTSRNAVQAFCDVVQSNTDAISEEVGADGVRVILAAMSSTGNMPATDTILREVGARAVEGFGDHVKGYNYSASWQSKEYAARIRAGEVPDV
ncbi:hypothetical protein CQW29_25615 [Pantoea coffeiphila]|uniref:Uncharacterized protein n=2 Tax=Pantoea coffeiphila TaxID=1465635 RepID=A0A2S9I4B7_9GAMM|nr:hypothetical protein CQW29_25615 [Pantoea coffeiphila]